MTNKKPFLRSPLRAPLMWIDFPWIADEWFVLYAYSHSSLTSVTMFALAHAVELYLKGCVAKYEFEMASSNRVNSGADAERIHEDSVGKAVGFGHKLVHMWRHLKAVDPTFMPEFELRDSVAAIAFTKSENDIQSVLSEADWDNYQVHRELYLVMKYTADLKYLGGPMKSEMHPHFFHELRSSYWITFVKSIREWIWRGQSDFADRMSMLVRDADRNGMPSIVAEYLKGLGLKENWNSQLLYSYQRIDDEIAIVYESNCGKDVEEAPAADS